MTSKQINKRLERMDNGRTGDTEGKHRIVYGWFWRDVDFDADSVTLAHNYTEKPDWWDSVHTPATAATQRAVFGKADDWRSDGGVRFCENNKWDYPMFEVSGDAWARLRSLCGASLEDEIFRFLQTLQP